MDPFDVLTTMPSKSALGAGLLALLVAWIRHRKARARIRLDVSFDARSKPPSEPPSEPPPHG